MVDVVLHLSPLCSVMYPLKLRKNSMGIDTYSTSFFFRHIFGIVRQSLVSIFSGMASRFTRPAAEPAYLI